MRQINLGDMQDTFLLNDGADAVAATNSEQRMEMGAMLTDVEKLQAMGLNEGEIVAVSVMVFGAFTAGLLTAERVMGEQG